MAHKKSTVDQPDIHDRITSYGGIERITEIAARNEFFCITNESRFRLARNAD